MKPASVGPSRVEANGKGISAEDLAAEEWPFVSRYLDVEGNRIHYIDEGRGPVLLFVHVGFWSFVWRDVVTRLRSEFRCISLDFPGTGFSTASTAHENTLAANTKVLDAFVQRLGLENLTLVMHDLGGPVGFGFGGRNPGLVRALVISNTFGWPLAEYKWIKRVLGLMSGPTMTTLNRRFNIVARMSSGRFGVGKQLSRRAKRTFLTPFRARSTRETWSELIGDPLRIEDDLAVIDRLLSTVLRDVPVLTIFGARNDPYDWQGRYARTFSHARPVVIEKGMHFPFMDDPERFSASIRDWWRDAVI